MKIGDAMERRSLAAGYDSDIKIRLSHTCKVYRPLPYLLSDPICMDEALTVGNVIVKKKGFFVVKSLSSFYLVIAYVMIVKYLPVIGLIGKVVTKTIMQIFIKSTKHFSFLFLFSFLTKLLVQVMIMTATILFVYSVIEAFFF